MAKVTDRVEKLEELMGRLLDKVDDLQTQGEEAFQRLARVETAVGIDTMGEAPSLSSQIGAIHGEMGQLAAHVRDVERMQEAYATDINGRIKDAGDKGDRAVQMIEAAKALAAGRIDGLQAELNILKMALGGATGVTERQRVKVPEPSPYDGTRDAKMVENFIWDMEHYFEAAHVPTEEKVTIAPMYLVGDAKLWWRSRQDARERTAEGTSREAARGTDTWEELKKELREQFLPLNASWLARDALRKLTHKGTVREYVMEFTSLMLDIRDMSEQDKLFNFMSGLQPWAQTELRRRSIQDLQAAIAAADALIDFPAMEASSGRRAEERRRPEKQQHEPGEKGEPTKEASGSKADRRNNPRKDRGCPVRGCFICGGPHWARECPKREPNPQFAAMKIRQEAEEEDRPARVNVMQLTGLQRWRISGKADEPDGLGKGSRGRKSHSPARRGRRVSSGGGECHGP